MSLNLDELIDYRAYYLPFVGKGKLNGEDQLTGLCPFHEEKNPSFGVNLITGQWICRSGCGSGNVVAFHSRIKGITEEESVKDLAETYGSGGSSRRSKPKKKAATSSTKKKDPSILPIETLTKLEEIPRAPLNYALTKRGWSKETIEKYQIRFISEGKRPSYAIPIFDEVGQLVNIRTYAPETEQKIMSWKKGFGSSRLFPISVLEEARVAGKPVILCEGEPDALCGLSHGLFCITHTTGAENWWTPHNAAFKDLDVIIAYDNDDAGRLGAQKVCKHLPYFARSVSVITWPDWMHEKEDLTDWFVKYSKTTEEFLSLPFCEVHPDESDGGKTIEDRLSELNQQYSVVMLGGKCVVMREIIDPVFNRKDITFSSFNDFRNFYSNEKHWVQNGTGKAKKKPVADIWLEQPERRQYQGIVFGPEGDVEGYYNLWRGFAVQPVKGNWDRFKEHLFESISGGNDEIFFYWLAWMADCVQNPGGPRPGTSIVMRGRQGVGKGAVAQYFGGIFGNHFLHLTQSKKLLGNFNQHLKDALLVFADEAFWAGDHSAEGTLRAMITEPSIWIEPKGKDAFSVRNHIRVIVASNNEWIVPAGMQERRFFVVDVFDLHQQDHIYFEKIYSEMKNGGQEALLYDLLEVDLSKVNLREFPKTEALLDQKIASMTTHEKFWFECLQRGSIKPDRTYWDELCVTRDIYNQYLGFCEQMGDRFPKTDSQFSKKLKELCPGIMPARPTRDGIRVAGYQFPPLMQCRESMGTILRHPIKWNEQIE